MKRAFDVIMSLVGIAILSPLLVVIALCVVFNDGTPVVFRQQRVGLNGRMFDVLKFRTMVKDAEKQGQLTVSGRDPRITPVGYYLRKLKFDELLQLVNVLKGDMSLVGPRPEVPKYVALYNEYQKKVLTVRPGITDSASLIFFNENELLESSSNPEQMYIDEILPRKLALQLDYVENRTLWRDVKIIFKTFFKIAH